MRGARGLYSDNVLSLRKLNISNEDVPYRIRVVGNNYKFIDEQYFQTIKDKDPYNNFRYRITSYYDDDNDYEKSLSLYTNSTLTQNVHFGVNEFRIRAVGKNGIRSEHIKDSVYISSTGMEKLYMLFCYDVLQEYFNDYLSEVFLNHSFLDEIDVGEILSDIFLELNTFSDDQLSVLTKELVKAYKDEDVDIKEKILFSNNEDITTKKENDLILKESIGKIIESFTDVILDELIKRKDVLDVDLLYQMLYYHMFELGEDLICLDNIVDNGLTDMLLDILIEEKVVKTFNNNIATEMLSEDSKDILLNIMDAYKRKISSEISNSYVKFKENDIALFMLKDIINEVFSFVDTRDGMTVSLNEDIAANPTETLKEVDKIIRPYDKSIVRKTETVDEIDQMKILKSATDLITESMKLFSDINRLPADDFSLFYTNFILEDLFVGMLMKEFLKEKDYDFKIFDQNSLEYRKNNNNSVNLVTYNEDELNICLDESLEKLIKKEIMENTVNISKKDKFLLQKKLNIPVHTFEILRIIEERDFLNIGFSEKIKTFKNDNLLISDNENINYCDNLKVLKNIEEINNIDDLLIKALDSIDLSFDSTIKRERDPFKKPIDYVVAWKYHFAKTMVDFFDEIANIENLKKNLDTQILDDAIDLDYNGNESIAIKFGGSLGMLPGEEALSRMGLLVLGAFKLGEGVMGEGE